jgi:hypothetical protein
MIFRQQAFKNSNEPLPENNLPNPRNVKKPNLNDIFNINRKNKKQE